MNDLDMKTLSDSDVLRLYYTTQGKTFAYDNAGKAIIEGSGSLPFLVRFLVGSFIHKMGEILTKMAVDLHRDFLVPTELELNRRALILREIGSDNVN